MNPHIYMVSFHRDALFAHWTLRSIRKNLSGAFGLTLVIPDRDAHCFSWFAQEFPEWRLVCFSEPEGKGFLTQMLVKCEADKYCPSDATAIVHWDSDCILREQRSIDTLFHEGKPIVGHGSYAEISKTFPQILIWQKAVRTAIGIATDMEFMRYSPLTFPIEIYSSTRDRVEAITRVPFAQHVFNCRNEYPQTFCEFNTLGTWAYTNHRASCSFRDWKLGPPWGWGVVAQFISPHGVDHRSTFGSGAGTTARELATQLGIL